MRRTRRVQHDAAGPRQCNRRREQFALKLWSGRTHPRAGAASGLPGGAAMRQDRYTARRRAPGRSPASGRTRVRRRGAPPPQGRGCSRTPGRPGAGWVPPRSRWRLGCHRSPRAVPSCRRVLRTDQASGRRRDPPAEPASRHGPPTGCPRPAPTPDRRAPVPAGRGRRWADTPRTASRRLPRPRRCRPDPRRSAHRGGRPDAPRVARRRRPAARPARRLARRAHRRKPVIQRGWALTNARWPIGSVVADGASCATQTASSWPAILRSTPLTKPARAVSNSTPACSTVVAPRRAVRRGCAAVGTRPGAADPAAPSRCSASGGLPRQR